MTGPARINPATIAELDQLQAKASDRLAELVARHVVARRTLGPLDALLALAAEIERPPYDSSDVRMVMLITLVGKMADVAEGEPRR